MRKLIACVASAALVLILPPIVNAAWQQVQLGDGTTVCKDDVTGAEFKPCDENTATSFLSWVLNSAVAATIRTRTLTNSDGTQDTTYPADSKPPSSSTFTWACDASLAVIANQNTGTATNINIDSCASGSGVSSATYSFVKASDLTSCSADWSVTGTYPNRLLHNAGSNTGSGTCRLKAVVSGSTTLSSTAYPWSYTTASSDTTAPNPVTGITCTAASPLTITCTFDSTVDPADGVQATGIKTYHFYRNGSLLTGQDLAAVSSGMVDDFTAAAIGTASGTATPTGASWTLFGNGGAGLEGTADNINQISMPVTGSSFDVITRVSTIQNSGSDNKSTIDFRESLNANAVSNNCTLDYASSILFANSRNRHTTGGSRQSSGLVATQISASFASTWMKCHYDSSGMDMYHSFDGGAWVTDVTDFPSAPLPSAKYVSIGCTATTASTSISCINDYITVNNVGTLSKTLTVPAGTATYTVKAEDNAGNLSSATGGWTGAPTTPTSSTLKFEPGWYVEYSAKCIPWDGVRYGCQTSSILSTIATEVCGNSNMVGFKMLVYPSFAIPNSASSGDYTGSTNQGFTAFDQIITALNNCNKHLILEVDYGEFASGPDAAISFYPNFVFPASCPAPLQCQGGTATSSNYGISASTQTSQPGQMANLWQSDWRLLAKAALTAYCNRYDSNPAFYAVAMFYTNLSLPIDPHNLPSGYSSGAFHTQYLTYLDEARAVCPTTNIIDVADFADPYPAQISAHYAKLATMHGTIANNDVSINEPSYGQVIYSGAAGSPTVIDYRGVVRYIEEVQSPDTCGYVNGGQTPAQLFAVMQNGNAAQRARWPSHIAVAMAPECDAFPTQSFAAWKTFIAGINGQVMNARDSTLRTVAAIKASWCETSMGGCP